MIIQADVKGLELVACGYLSQDDTLCNELRNEVDIHGSNQHALKLPSRLIAKTFVFRLIYGGSAWAYCYDPNFNWISKSDKYWQKVIDAFYDKYGGISMWHMYLMHEATTTGKIVIPTGRFFPFKPEQKHGEWKWPATKIKNYPVQGLGADLVCLARVYFAKRFKEENIVGCLVSSVHDSIVCDVHLSEIDRTRQLLRESVERVPVLFREIFGEEFNLPLRGEILAGPNCKDMLEI